MAGSNKKSFSSFLKATALVLVFAGVFASFAALAYIILQQTDPHARLARELINDDKTILKAYFSPDDDVRTLLISLIDAEQKRIRIACYTLTDNQIAQALLRAQSRWVTIEAVVDRGFGADKYSKIGLLANARIPLWVYQTSQDDRKTALMHHKFILFDENIEHRSLVWTGSYNFTARASDRNQENVLILDDKRIVERFRNQFELLKERSLQISGEIQNNGINSIALNQPDPRL